ncbi:conserved hypothetical protein [Pseudomonas sp. IT-232MI5]
MFHLHGGLRPYDGRCLGRGRPVMMSAPLKSLGAKDAVFNHKRAAETKSCADAQSEHVR